MMDTTLASSSPFPLSSVQPTQDKEFNVWWFGPEGYVAYIPYGQILPAFQPPYQLTRPQHSTSQLPPQPHIPLTTGSTPSVASQPQSHSSLLSSMGSIEEKVTKMDILNGTPRLPSEIDLAKFSEVLRNVASGCKPDAAGFIMPQQIDWLLVAKHFDGQTAATCKYAWSVFFHGCYLLKKGKEVVICKAPTNLTSQKSEISDDATPGVQSSESSSVRSRKRSLDGKNDRNPKRKPRGLKKPWSASEEKHIAELQKEYGNKWTFIAKRLGTDRSGNDVKNYWHSKEQKLAMQLLRSTSTAGSVGFHSS